MNFLKRLGIIVWIGSLLFLTACLMNNTIPELEKPDVPPDPANVIINITEPNQNEVLPWLASQNIRVKVTGIEYLPAEFQVFLNDSLYEENNITYGSTYNFHQSTAPYRWTQPNSPFVVKAILTDALDSTFVDSVVANVGAYFEAPPVMLGPDDGKIFLMDSGNTLDLEIESYSGVDWYSYCVGTDSLFTDATYFSATSRTYGFTPPSIGSYYWRVRAIGAYGIESPWSDTRGFSILNDIAYSTDFLSISQIGRVIKGANSYFLLGRNGNMAAVMKCDEQMVKLWALTFPTPSATMAVDCDELDDGSIFFALTNEDSFPYEDWVYLLSAGGQNLWNGTIGDYPSITSIRALSEDSFVCGFTGSTGPHVVMMDTDGILAWEFDNGSTAECKRLHKDSSRGVFNFLLSGNSTYQLGELDFQGQETWRHSINIAASGIDPNFALVSMADGDFVIGSTIDLSSTPEYIYLAKMGASGSIAWQTNFRPSASLNWNLGAVNEHTDGSLFIAGTTRSGSYNSSDAFLARLDSGGRLDWVRVFESDDFKEYGKGLAILDEMVILLGYRLGGATDTPLAIKVDFYGNVIFE